MRRYTSAEAQNIYFAGWLMSPDGITRTTQAVWSYTRGLRCFTVIRGIFFNFFQVRFNPSIIDQYSLFYIWDTEFLYVSFNLSEFVSLCWFHHYINCNINYAFWVKSEVPKIFLRGNNTVKMKNKAFFRYCFGWEEK